MKCQYGCGREGKYYFESSKKMCCESHFSRCPENRRKNSKGLKKAYKEGRKKDPSTFSEETKFKMGSGNRGKPARNAYTKEEVFVEGKKFEGFTIRRLYLKEVPYKCEECGLTKWKNKDIVLEVHHINGKLDNRIESLKLLCPNCHSQQPFHKGRS